MDSKVLRRALLTVTLFVASIFVFILAANGYIGRDKNATSDTVVQNGDEAEAFADKDGRIKGSDLDAWKYDETFFDAHLVGDGKYEQPKEGDNVALAVSASSVEKDLRIRKTDTSGNLVKDQLFTVMVGNTGEYKDDDRDGLIYISGLTPGDYEVKLAAMAGFDVPGEPLVCSVKARLEYKVISDISYLIKTEADIDAEKEDTGINDAAEDTSGTDVVKNEENAVFGIDVSKFNNITDWNAVKESGVKFVIIRCGYRGSKTGSIVEDPQFRENINGAVSAGIPVGVYFFTQAVNTVEAVEEASAVVSLVGSYDLTYPIFIDTESAGGGGRADTLDAGSRSAVVEAFCETIRNSGYKAGIYASKNWYNGRLDITKFSSSDVMWLAEYNDKVTYGGNYSIWQYSSAGHIDGIDGRVDMNLSYLKVDR